MLKIARMIAKKLLPEMAKTVIIAHIPDLQDNRGTGGTDSARYCYSVWLRHLVMAFESGLAEMPGTVAELGPGDSIGIGLAALLSGAEKYYALDVVEFAELERNLNILDELVELFRRREGIPDEREFPEAKPLLKSYGFPKHILTDGKLERSLGNDRIESIRNAIMNMESGSRNGAWISYIVPWNGPGVILGESLDMLYSQAALEHVEDLPGTYAAMACWLKPGAMMSHQIDFRSHGTARDWNGHWEYSDFKWKLLKGRRSFLINRHPLSFHIEQLGRNGFDIVRVEKVRQESGIGRERLAKRFRGISDEDFVTGGAFIQAVRKPDDNG